MRLTTLLILLVSVSIVYCEVQIDVIAVDTNGNHNGNKETEPPSWISDSVHKVILSALELDGGSTKPIYLGFGPTAKEHVVYLQVMVKNEDSTVHANAPCRSGGVKCFGFISTNGHVGLFRLLKEPKQYPIGFTSKMQCPMETIAYEEKVEKEVSMESAKEWYSIAAQMYTEFGPFNEAFKDANRHTTPSQKAEALSRMPEMYERFFGHHAVMAKKQMEGGERKEKDKGREKEMEMLEKEKGKGRVVEMEMRLLVTTCANLQKTLAGRVGKPSKSGSKPPKTKTQRKQRLKPGAN